MNQSPIHITLRQNIAPPVTAVIHPTDLTQLAQLSVEVGILFLLERADCSEAFRRAFLDTLHDPRAIVEIRQGERVQVLARQKALPAEWLPATTLPTLPAIEIGVSKAQSGG
jgi:hypothetical protein